MNPVTKILWRWLGKQKLDHDDIGIRYTAIRKIGEAANKSDLDLLLSLHGDSSQIMRNAASHAIRHIMSELEGDEFISHSRMIVDHFTKSNSLREKIALVESMQILDLNLREEVFGPLVKESENDLRYVILQVLRDTQNYDILDDILEVSDTPDLVLRRIALQTWYQGVANRDKESLEYCTPRMHYLIRACYELQTDGNFLRTMLSYATRKKLPHPKAYPDFIIRYMTELLGRWEYDPDAYNSLHAIMVPSYFTFDDAGSEDERPYIIL